MFSITQDLAQRVSDDVGNEQMDVEEELGISVYPNPFTDEIVISTEADDNVKIYTSQGRLVLEKALTRGESLIQTSLFSSGMYFIQFTNAGITLKMIKP